MTDDQSIETLEEALKECAGRVEALEKLLVECIEVFIARDAHDELVTRICHLLDEEPPASIRRSVDD